MPRGTIQGKEVCRERGEPHKDQEVSTTHGKFVVEGDRLGAGLKFYFVDVGSTNGTEYGGEKLEPDERLLLEDGMELKVGNSMLTVVLG